MGKRGSTPGPDGSAPFGRSGRWSGSGDVAVPFGPFGPGEVAVPFGPFGPGEVAVDERAADPDADPYSVARAIALRQLAMMPRSRVQLRAKMDQRNVPGAVAEAVLDRLEEVGLLDDEAFAQSWVRSRQSTRGLARRALAHELRTKGVDDDTARAALDELSPEDELAAARRLVARRLAATRRLGRAARTRRLAAMLARKGYPAGIAVCVVREALDAERAETS